MWSLTALRWPTHLTRKYCAILITSAVPDFTVRGGVLLFSFISPVTFLSRHLSAWFPLFSLLFRCLSGCTPATSAILPPTHIFLIPCSYNIRTHHLYSFMPRPRHESASTYHPCLSAGQPAGLPVYFFFIMKNHFSFLFACGIRILPSRGHLASSSAQPRVGFPRAVASGRFPSANARGNFLVLPCSALKYEQSRSCSYSKKIETVRIFSPSYFSQTVNKHFFPKCRVECR